MKASLILAICACVFLACHQENNPSIPVLEKSSNQDSASIAKNDTITLLKYGELEPTLHLNAQDIIFATYKIKYKIVTGYEVSEDLLDSIKKVNAISYSMLNQSKFKNSEAELEEKINSEYQNLTSLDSKLRITHDKEIKKYNLNLIYFIKLNQVYQAYFLRGEPEPQKLKFRLKHLVLLDSARREVISSVPKDELVIGPLKYLKHD